MKDSWESGDPYEYFMGRWSRLVAKSFVEWLAHSPGLKWLDVGCGSGALSEEIIMNHEPAKLTAIDQSEHFVSAARKRLGTPARCMVGDAVALPLEGASVDISVSGLVLNFIPDPLKALEEMMRVTAPGGAVAAYVWDYAGRMDFLRYFWDVAVELDPKASGLHEAVRYADANAETLKGLFAEAGFERTVTSPMEVETRFQGFDDYWKPFLGGQGPAPTYVSSLHPSERNKLRDALHERLPIRPDGSIPMLARAWAACGHVSLG